MKTSKRICKNGSITLPKQIRGEAGLFPGNAVDIERHSYN
jgi:bifunctional DNA-binding transcriptional regulator/antitoxin component of YhaV-PrlF toxin-antitoxin module